MTDDPHSAKPIVPGGAPDPTPDLPPDNAELKRRAAVSVRWTTLSSLINTVVQLVQISVLTRLIGGEAAKAEFGLLAMAMVVILFAQLFEDMGLTLAVVHRKENSRNQLSSLFWTNATMSLGMFAALQLLTPAIVSWNRNPAGLEPLIRLAACVFLISPFGQVSQAILWKRSRFKDLAVAEISATVLGMIVACVLAAMGYGAMSMVLGALVRTTVLSGVLYFRALDLFTIRSHFARTDLRGYLGFGAYQMADRVFLYGVRHFDKLMIGRRYGESILGPYSLVFTLVLRPVTALNPILTRVTSALFSEIQDDEARLRRGMVRQLSIQTFVMAPVFFGMLAVAEPLVVVYLGEPFRDAATVLQYLACLGLAFSWRNGMGTLFIAKGRADLALWTNVVAGLLAGLAVWLGLEHGVERIALYLLFAALLAKPFEVWAAKALIGLQFRQWLGAVLPCTSLSAAMAAGVLALDSTLPTDWADAWRLGILVAAGGALYVALALVFRGAFTRDVIRLLRGR